MWYLLLGKFWLLVQRKHFYQGSGHYSLCYHLIFRLFDHIPRSWVLSLSPTRVATSAKCFFSLETVTHFSCSNLNSCGNTVTCQNYMARIVVFNLDEYQNLALKFYCYFQLPCFKHMKSPCGDMIMFRLS